MVQLERQFWIKVATDEFAPRYRKGGYMLIDASSRALGRWEDPANHDTRKVFAPLKDADLAAENSFLWLNQTVIPRVMKYLQRHHPRTSDKNVLQVLNMITRGNQLAGGVLGEFYMKRKFLGATRAKPCVGGG